MLVYRLKEMFPMMIRILVFVVGTTILVHGHLNQTSEASLTISHQARSLQPGEVVLLNVVASVPTETVTAHAFDKTVYFFEAGQKRWQGLLGIDLQKKPGRYKIDVELTTTEGASLRKSYPITVSPKDFPTRHLKVASNFVAPPESVLERILDETKRVAQIFGATAPQRLWEGPFEAPVPGSTTSSFGRRSVFNGQPRNPHTGTDFRAAKNTPVKAPNAGVVVLSSELYFSGNTVILNHGWGLYSYLAHLSRTAVKEGESVATGDIVGYVGATGRVTGPHLHWTVRLNEARVDPLSLITALSY